MEQVSKLELTDRLPRIVAFDRTKPYCWSTFPTMLERIGKFADEYCSDTVGSLLVESVMQDFAQPRPAFFILGALDDDYDLKGHLLACVSVPSWSTKRRCLILQYELNQGLPIGLMRAGFDMLIDWAKMHYCDSIIAETKREEAKRTFETFYGFKTDLVQITRGL